MEPRPGQVGKDQVGIGRRTTPFPPWPRAATLSGRLGIEQRSIALSFRMKWIASALATALVACTCEPLRDDSREEEQAVLRAQRLARARAARARRARLARRARQERNRQRLVGQVSAGAPGPRAASGAQGCDPAKELEKRASSGAASSLFARSVSLVLTPISADLVVLEGRPWQRFTFVVRMHPGDAPVLGRRRHPPVLELRLRRLPLCGKATPSNRLAHPLPATARVTQATARPTETLRMSLVRLRKGHRPPGAVTSAWPHRSGRGRLRLVVGVPIQLLLDPYRASLAPGPRSPSPGLWEVRGARFVGRPRLRRLSLASSLLPPSLRALHLLEVACPGGPGGRCRFLTRREGRQAVAIPWRDLLRRVAPPWSRGILAQLHQIDLQLHFPGCLGDPRAASGRRGRHRCLRSSSMPCRVWRAFHGYANRPRIQVEGDRATVSQVLTCSGKRRRVILLRTSYGARGRYRRRTTDLTDKVPVLLHRLRRARRPGRP